MATKQPMTVASTFAQGSQPNPQGNFLERFGIDPRSQQAILAAAEQQRIRDAVAYNDKNREQFAGQHLLEDSGAAIAALLANKFNKPELTEEQKRGQEAKQQAEQAVALMEAGGAFDNGSGDVDPLKKANEYQRVLAGNLIKVGDPRGIDMARELDERMKQEEVYKEERTAAGLDIDGKRIDNTRNTIGIARDRLALEKSQFDHERGKFLIKRGELAPVYMAGSDNPNASIMAYIGDDGSATTMDKNKNIYSIPLGEYTTVRPDDPSANGGSGTDRYVPTPTEQANIRASQRSIMTQMRLAGVMVDALVKSTDETGTIDIMDGAGKFQTFAVNLANNTNAVLRQGEKWIGLTDGDPNDPNSKILGRVDGTISGAMNYVKSNAEYMNTFIPIPDNIREGSVQAQRYQAAVVQMAYAKARANEPGARQLSDADFKNAIKQIGAAATDPEALRQILVDNVDGSGKEFEFWNKQIGAERAAQIVGPEAMAEYNQERKNFDKKFEKLFGTPEKPTGAVAPPPPEVTAPDRQETPEERRQRILNGTPSTTGTE